MRSEDEIRMELVFWSGFVEGLSKVEKKQPSFGIPETKRDVLRWVLGEDVVGLGLGMKLVQGEKQG